MVQIHAHRFAQQDGRSVGYALCVRIGLQCRRKAVSSPAASQRKEEKEKMYEWERNQLRAAGFIHDWTFIELCIKEKMRKRGIKTIPITGYYSPSTAKVRQITYDTEITGGNTKCLEKWETMRPSSSGKNTRD